MQKTMAKYTKRRDKRGYEWKSAYREKEALMLERGYKDMDKIQFEYRYEVQELMKVIDKYVKQNPAEKENKTLERFFDLLDVMDMEW